MKCPRHPQYKGIKPTVRECSGCQILFLFADIIRRLDRIEETLDNTSELARRANGAAATALYVANR